MSNDSEVLELLYNKLKSYGRLDKEGVLRILGLEYTNWNMRKALNYLKDLANKYEDVELKKGDKGKYYVEWSGYSEAVKDDIKKSFDAEAFEKDFWRNVYYIAIDRIKPGDTICRVIEVMDIRDFTKIWKKYKLWIVGDWINLKLSTYAPVGSSSDNLRFIQSPTIHNLYFFHILVKSLISITSITLQIVSPGLILSIAI